MPFTEDLSPFFNVSEFADEVLLAGQPVNAIFDAAAERVQDGMVTGVGPELTLPTAVCLDVSRGTAVVVRGQTYQVSQPPEPDGTGVTFLQLRKAS